ncbi:hypothetical protein [Niabella aquatica]
MKYHNKNKECTYTAKNPATAIKNDATVNTLSMSFNSRTRKRDNWDAAIAGFQAHTREEREMPIVQTPVFKSDTENFLWNHSCFDVTENSKRNQ